MKTLFSSLAIALLCVSSAHADWPINDKCPVDGKAARPIYRIKTKEGPVAFCCGDCMDKFEKSPATYKVEKKEYKK
jgi:hypothetical protein